MLTPEQLKIIPEGMVGLYQDLEEFVIKDFARRVAKAGKITATAEWQAIRAEEIGMAMFELEKEIKRITKLSQDEIDALMHDVAELSLQNDAPIYENQGEKAPNLEKSETLQKYVSAATEQTKGDLFNMSQSLGFARKVGNKIEYLPMFEFYNKALDLAQFQVSTGVLDYNTATRNAVKQIAQSGLRWVDYESGWHNRVDVAARRAVMTGVNQMSSKMNDKVAKDLDADYVEVTAHSGARPDHAEWQGKVFKIHGSSKGYPNLAAATGLGTVTGLCGANCRHNYYAFFPGISAPSYSEKELKSIDPEPFEYEGNTYNHYEATQKQRQVETAMRQSKNELIGYDTIGDKDAFTTASIKLQRQKQFYNEFSKAAGLTLQNERHQVMGFNRSISKKAVIANKKATKDIEVVSKNDIIKKDALHPKEIAGVKRGKAMTREEANQGNANPDYSKGGGYRINCQTCVVSFEARLRGYNVKAMPNMPGSKLEKLSRKTNLAWIDPKTGIHPEYILNREANTAAKFFKFMDSTVEKGNRYTLEFSWKGRSMSGHIISLDRTEDDVIRLYDPQTSRIYVGEEKVAQYLKQFKYQTTVYGTKIPVPPKILRIDNMGFNPDFIDDILTEARNE